MAPYKKKQDYYITKSQVCNGIYIDFEGFKDAIPAFTGILIEGEFLQIVHEPILESAAKAKKLPLLPFKRTIEWIVKKAKKEDRNIIAYSSHELAVASRFSTAGLEMSDFYKDARKIAKKWFNKYHYGESINGWGLKDFMEYLKDPMPSYFGHLKATKKLKYVIDMLPQKRSYDELTPAAKKHWTNLLKYNKWDCRAVYKLLSKVKSVNKVNQPVNSLPILSLYPPISMSELMNKTGKDFHTVKNAMDKKNVTWNQEALLDKQALRKILPILGFRMT